MEVMVFKNPLAIRYIRCISRVPNTRENAGGAGFTLGQALARLRSELVEREHHLTELLPTGIRPVGIAAHLDESRARQRAMQEAAESLCLKQIQTDASFNCVFKISLSGMTLGIAKTSLGYFALLRGSLHGRSVAAHSAAPGLLSTLLKVWEEFQSMLFFRPQGDHLRRFTKANLIFSDSELARLSFRFVPGYVYRPELSSLLHGVTERGDRVVVYYYACHEEEQSLCR